MRGKARLMVAAVAVICATALLPQAAHAGFFPEQLTPALFDYITALAHSPSGQGANEVAIDLAKAYPHGLPEGLTPEVATEQIENAVASVRELVAEDVEPSAGFLDSLDHVAANDGIYDILVDSGAGWEIAHPTADELDAMIAETEQALETAEVAETGATAAEVGGAADAGNVFERFDDVAQLGSQVEGATSDAVSEANNPGAWAGLGAMVTRFTNAIANVRYGVQLMAEDVAASGLLPVALALAPITLMPNDTGRPNGDDAGTSSEEEPTTGTGGPGLQTGSQSQPGSGQQTGGFDYSDFYDGYGDYYGATGYDPDGYGYTTDTDTDDGWDEVDNLDDDDSIYVNDAGGVRIVTPDGKQTGSSNGEEEDLKDQSLTQLPQPCTDPTCTGADDGVGEGGSGPQSDCPGCTPPAGTGGGSEEDPPETTNATPRCDEATDEGSGEATGDNHQGELDNAAHQAEQGDCLTDALDGGPSSNGTTATATTDDDEGTDHTGNGKTKKNAGADDNDDGGSGGGGSDVGCGGGVGSQGIGPVGPSC